MTASRLLSLTLAIVILLGSGMLYHCLARDSEQLEVAAARLPGIPLEVGDWKAFPVQEQEMDERMFERAGAKAHWMRSYIHQRTKISLLVILMCGRAGKMAVHTPEICYRGAGYELLERPAVCPVKNDLGEEMGRFWTAQFTKKASKLSLRLYWAWNVHDAWQAAQSPRWQYRGEPYLCKLYVSRDLNHAPPVAAQADPAVDFLRQFLPEVKGMP